MGTIKYLGTHAHCFQRQVDEVMFPNYHRIITNPMWTNRIGRKLSTQRYASPEEFHADFKLLWNNCSTYHSADMANHGMLAIGAGAEKKYHELWVESGLATKVRTMQTRVTQAV